jgi:perosamine synthetase
MKHGDVVSRYEAAFAERVGAKYAIATSNGTVSLEVALRAMDVEPGDRVATTPLTMSATTIAILNVGAVPVYCDVDPATWLLGLSSILEHETRVTLPVSLYGLHMDWCGSADIDDAAQTLRPHRGAAFNSYSTQQSKIISTGEGGMLTTNNRDLATRARSIASLGYDMDPQQARIDSHALRRPDFVRHVRYPAMNARMNDVTAQVGLMRLRFADKRLSERRNAAACYADAATGCVWLTPQAVSPGMGHDWWSWAATTDTPTRAVWLADAVERHGGERPYFAWRISYQEPALRHLAPDGTCPIAESVQPRILAFQTNDPASAERNATALRRAIQEAEG